VLLKHVGVQKVIICGFAGDIWVLYTETNAYMRDFEITVSSDCVASETLRANQYALNQMQRFLKAAILPSSKISFDVS